MPTSALDAAVIYRADVGIGPYTENHYLRLPSS